LIKKIKKYKIAVRPHAVLRILKKKALAGPGETAEDRFKELIDRAQGFLSPSAVYESFSRGKTPAGLSRLWEGAPPKALGLSLVLVTVGSPISRAIAEAREKEGEVRAAHLDAVAEEGLEQAAGFVEKLLKEEAENESCELTPLLPVDSSLLGELSRVLDSAKADIVTDGSGRLLPAFSSAGYCFWNPVAKGRSARSR